MKKILVLLFCLLVALCSLQGCGDGNGTTSSTGGSTAKEHVFKDFRYVYDLDEYITLPDFESFSFELELDALQQKIDNSIIENAIQSKRTVCMQGDVVSIYYVAYRIDENGEIIYNDNSAAVVDEKENYFIYIGSKLAHKELENGVIGMSVGEIKDIFVTFPSDYENEEIAGERVLFEVCLEAVYDAEIYNFLYVKKYFPEFSTTEEFEQSFKNDIAFEELCAFITENAVVKKYPEKERELLVKSLKDSEAEFEKNYKITLDEYIAKNYNMTRDEYINSTIKNEMVLYALGELLEIEITNQMLLNERNGLISYYAEYYKGLGVSQSQATQKAEKLVDDLGDYYVYENVLNSLLNEALAKTVKYTEKEKTYESVTTVLADRQKIPTGNLVGNLCLSLDLEIFNGYGSFGTTLNPSKNVGKYTVIYFFGIWDEESKSILSVLDGLSKEYKESLTVYAVHSAYEFRDAADFVLENYKGTEIVFLKDTSLYSGQVGKDEGYTKLGGEGTYPYALILDEIGVIKATLSGAEAFQDLENQLSELAK